MRMAAIVIVLSLVLLSTTALAEVPGLMNYQGTLTDGDGVALDTTVSMTFSLYTDSTGGTQVWTETQAAVAVSSGLFDVLLGSVNAISDTVFNDPVRWLGIQVGADPELTPRQRIASVGYAFQAAEADTADYARNGVGGDDGDWTISGNDIYSALPGNVGIGTASPSTKLDIRGTLSVGADGNGHDVNFYGLFSGSRLLWDESKMALRAGQDSDGTHWHPDSIGYHSFATGSNTKATKDWSVATGVYTNALGFAATAMGGYNTAIGIYSTALGRNNTASGNYSTATGEGTEASGLYSTAMGRDNTASGYASTALGNTTIAGGGYSTAMGYYTTSSGDYSIAMGRFAAVDADNAVVLGKGISSISRLMNSVENSLVVGFDDTTATLFVGGPDHRVGVGTTTPAAKLDVQGTLNVGVDDTGYDVNFYGAGSGSRFFWDEDKMALRAGRDVDGTHWASDSVGQYSQAIGYDTKAGGEGSTALGLKTTANGKWATAIGANTMGSGWSSTAMGLWTTASGDYSTAIGRYLTAEANDAIVLGRGVIAANRLVNNVENSLMVGFDTTAATFFVGGSDHRVGIGTTTPTAKLDVQGTVTVGVDDTGYDVNFYGANSGGRFFWDEDKMALRAGRDTDGTHWASDSTGSYSLATGYNTKASGPYSAAMGINTAASGDFSTAMGLGTTASGNRSTAMGDGTIASGYYSTAMGHDTEASLDRATAMGYQTTASGIVSTAMGEGTIASGERSTAMGGYTESSGDFSTAMGLYTTSGGDYSVAAGRYVTAQATDAIVLGHGLTSASRLVNNTSNSLMVGFNDTTATLFVGGANHRVGIGTTSPAYKLEVEGDAHVTQDITRAFTAGTSNLATPIAYAFINSGGAVVSGTPNVSSSWNGASSRYEISISGETYFYSNYVTQVTVSSGSRYTATTNSSGGELLVFIYDTSGTKTQQAFQFVTYKP